MLFECAISFLGLDGLDFIDDTIMRKAWKKKMLAHHPDKNNSPDAHVLSQKINEALPLKGDSVLTV